jgi:hypothetical protein
MVVTTAILIVVAVVHFVPTIIAVRRQSKNRIGVFLLNLLLGWTIIGWFAALVWALSGERERSPSPAHIN